MTLITYTWKVISVDIFSNTFVVEYSSTDGASLRLNLPLPTSIDQILEVVKLAAPQQISVPDTTLINKTLIDSETVLAMKGTISVTPAVTTIDANEMFKKQVATALFELGITSNNMYIAPVTPAATTATTTSTGSEPTVIG